MAVSVTYDLRDCHEVEHFADVGGARSEGVIYNWVTLKFGNSPAHAIVLHIGEETSVEVLDDYIKNLRLARNILVAYLEDRARSQLKGQ